MSKTILAQVEGFTPVIDAIVDDVGLMPAVVFGRVWRYCQMKDGKCKASIQTIADGVGIHYNTALSHIKTLVDAGYLLDATPDRRNAPHEYFDTGRAMVEVKMEAGLQEIETEVHTKCGARSTLDVDEDSLLRESSKTDTNGASAPPPVTFKQWQNLVRESKNRTATLRYMIKTLFPYLKESDLPDYGRIGKAGKRLTANRLCQLIWDAARFEPQGDVISYIEAMERNAGGSNGTGRTRNRGRASNSIGPAPQSRARSGESGGGEVIDGRYIYETEVEGGYSDEEMDFFFEDYPNWRQMRDEYAASIGA